MPTQVSKRTRAELIQALGQRYRVAAKREKTRILDEFVAVAGCHRKHAIRMLNGCDDSVRESATAGKRIYDEGVREALILIWEAADRICERRVAIPRFHDRG